MPRLVGVSLDVGDEVRNVSPGRRTHHFGAFGEYAVTGQGDVAVKPASMSFEEAGAVGIAGYTAVQAVRDWGKVRAGQTVLINGAAIAYVEEGHARGKVVITI